ncbi:MAG: riboflavin biosynthesis protein RibF [Rhodobiaceae bacterium]|jgi:riboflavin kinase/FMN adenylyltransferase|nr:riboflavin biosynthesis protein RibF [Rhodobiaceae bacterium]|tara:strand:- start:8141 stop:9079 length:939 start_codon:yes stop_codon:yes gene_type:complete
MIIIKNIKGGHKIKPNGVYAIGNFDGIHLGHKEILENTKRISSENNKPCGIIMFEPHPQKFFKTDLDGFYLSNLETKQYLLKPFDIDFFIVLEFDNEMAQRTPEEFVKDIIVNSFQASHVVVGYDFRFGSGRIGNADSLQEICSSLDIGVSIIEKQKKGDKILSSSIIRNYLSEGKIGLAEEMLGHRWVVKSTVVSGDKRGREIGFPTANIPMKDWIQPKYGVYAVIVEFNGKIYKGISNLGIRPTFDETEPMLETYLFDFSGDLYDKDIIVSFVDFIREEKKFDGIDSLRSQIEEDSIKAKKILSMIKLKD